MMVTDINANITQAVLYAPFGQIITEYRQDWMLDTIPRYLFNAKELDAESGMYYYEARYYAPPTFISPDPLFEKYPWMSKYAYCNNNPILWIDPTGMEVEDVEKTFNPNMEKYNVNQSHIPEVDMTKYYNDKGKLLYETKDGLNVDIIVPNGNIPQLQNELQTAKDNGTINDPKTNQQKMHPLGKTPQEYSEATTKGQSDNYQIGYRETYKKSYKEGKGVFRDNFSLSQIISSIVGAIAVENHDQTGQDIHAGRVAGIQDGNDDKKAGRINRIYPTSSFQNNSPLIKLK
jgi:RHS repeat-associated protein